jgi:ankyrin repeat protein
MTFRACSRSSEAAPTNWPPCSTPTRRSSTAGAPLLLDHGADVDARADIDASGVGGQTPIFHALTHFKGANPEVAQLLIDRGADRTIRARVPGHYERPGEILDMSAAEYGAIFPLRGEG